MTCKFLPLINDLVFVRVCRRSRRGLRLFLASFSASDDAVIAYADEYEWEEDEWELDEDEDDDDDDDRRRGRLCY